MQISSFRVKDYKSLRDTGEIRLGLGFNVIVGENNVGKTALLEALSLTFQNLPHRSPQTVPTPNTPRVGPSSVEATIELSRDELIHHLRQLGNFWVPHVPGRTTREGAQRLTDSVGPTNLLRTLWHNGTVAEAAFSNFDIGPAANHSILTHVSPEDQFELAQDSISGVAEDQRFEKQIAEQLRRQRIYKFDAERLHVGVSPQGPNTILKPDASNLPEVLQNLQGRNPKKFTRLEGYVRTIFPALKGVSVRPVAGNNCEILIWTTDPASEREDLAMRLNDSGTGIGQVLAMLYVASDPHTQQVILIDEPQSFLHPGAIRKLIEILGALPIRHQFVITTHSSAAVTAAEPETLLLLRLQDSETRVQRLDRNETKDLGLFLAEVGARLSDVFGADSILWVEGRTEERAFPRILQRLSSRQLLGTEVIGVLSTGDFDAWRSEATIELYNRLSTGRGLLPPAIGFVFDREKRSATDIEDLKRRGKVFFLGRRMYENYLLSPAAIAAVATSLPNFRDPALTGQDVTEWLNAHRWDSRFFKPLPEDRTEETWHREVRGDKVLEAMFRELSEQRVEYDKVRHGAALTDWLLDHAPGDLVEVAQVLNEALVGGGGR